MRKDRIQKMLDKKAIEKKRFPKPLIKSQLRMRMMGFPGLANMLKPSWDKKWKNKSKL